MQNYIYFGLKTNRVKRFFLYFFWNSIRKEILYWFTIKTKFSSDLLSKKHFHRSAIFNSKNHRNLLWIYPLLFKNLPNFVSPNLKLHNQYCHDKKYWRCTGAGNRQLFRLDLWGRTQRWTHFCPSCHRFTFSGKISH